MKDNKGALHNHKELNIIVLFIVVIITANIILVNAAVAEKKKTSVESYKRVKITFFEDREFDSDSKISTKNFNKVQANSLYKLCKIWGFIKYYHPMIAKGTINWDYDLFRVMSKVLKMNDEKKVDKVIYEWIDSIGKVQNGSLEKASTEILLEPDLNWLKDTKLLGLGLSNLLVKIQSAKRTGYNYYVDLAPYAGYPIFVNENSYPLMNYEDDGYKLLALFRYWNIIEYFFPYRNIMDENWDSVLKYFIPKIILCDDELSYKTTIGELIGKIQDGHAYINLDDEIFRRALGANTAPLKLKLIENKVVVVEKFDYLKDDSKISVGDVILKINNIGVEELIRKKLKYAPQANKAVQHFWLLPLLLRTNEQYIEVQLQREQDLVSEKIKCTYDFSSINKGKPIASHKLLVNNIGYIYPGSLVKGEIDSIMKEYKDTNGLIIDLRCYPTDFIPYSLGNFLMPVPTEFVKVSSGSLKKPGQFKVSQMLSVGSNNSDVYKGKVIIIINEDAMSQSEFTTMALMVAPNATVVGSNSYGADGNSSQIILPGNVITQISGVGIYYPDGKQTQRIGIVPDIEVKPTIEGIRSGRDELLDRAIQLINKQE